MVVTCSGNVRWYGNPPVRNLRVTSSGNGPCSLGIRRPGACGGRARSFRVLPLARKTKGPTVGGAPLLRSPYWTSLELIATSIGSRRYLLSLPFEAETTGFVQSSVASDESVRAGSPPPNQPNANTRVAVPALIEGVIPLPPVIGLRSRGVLETLYRKKHLSAREIERLLGVSHAGVLEALDRLAIPRNGNGRKRTGQLPFGFDYLNYQLVENAVEQAAIRKMRRYWAGGLSLRQIAAISTRCSSPPNTTASGRPIPCGRYSHVRDAGDVSARPGPRAAFIRSRLEATEHGRAATSVLRSSGGKRARARGKPRNGETTIQLQRGPATDALRPLHPNCAVPKGSLLAPKR